MCCIYLLPRPPPIRYHLRLILAAAQGVINVYRQIIDDSVSLSCTPERIKLQSPVSTRLRRRRVVVWRHFLPAARQCVTGQYISACMRDMTSFLLPLSLNMFQVLHNMDVLNLVLVTLCDAGINTSKIVRLKFSPTESWKLCLTVGTHNLKW